MEVKAGKDASGKQTDSLVTFMLNDNKVVLHCYHTTQLILVNGTGYKRLVDVLLKPYFEIKIQQNSENIGHFNENALSILKSKQRGSVRFSTNEVHLMCPKCDYSCMSKSSMARHRKLEHTGNSLTLKKGSSTLLALPKYQSTRNNSLDDGEILQENLTLNSIENAEVLKFTCLQCDFVAKSKQLVDEHVFCEHASLAANDVEFVCGICTHRFENASEFHVHLKSHGDISVKPSSEVDINIPESTESVKETETVGSSSLNTNCFENEVRLLREQESVQESNANQLSVNCPFCQIVLNDLDDLRVHIESTHPVSKNTSSKDDSKSEIHMTEKQNQAKTNIKCSYCDVVLDNEKALQYHVMKLHEKRLLFYSMASKVDNIDEKLNALETFKNETLASLSQLRDLQNSIKNELFLIRDSKMNKHKSDLLNKKEEVANDKNPSPEPDLLFSSAVKKNPSSQTDHPSKNSKIEVSVRRDSGKKQIEDKVTNDVIWFGTKMNSKPLNNNKVENGTDIKLRVFEVDGITNDREGKDKKRSLKNTVNSVLNKCDPNLVILYAGDEEISNIDSASSIRSKRSSELQKQWVANVEQDSREIFSIAQDAVKDNPKLKVMIVKRLPRYDAHAEDPMSIKARLSDLANGIYKQEWLKQGSPQNIHIVDINLGCETSQHLKQVIYGRSDSPQYDGVNLTGPGASRHFSYRVKQTILALMKTDTVAVHNGVAREERKNSNIGMTKQPIKPRYNVAVSNTFEVLGNL